MTDTELLDWLNLHPGAVLAGPAKWGQDAVWCWMDNGTLRPAYNLRTAIAAAKESGLYP